MPPWALALLALGFLAATVAFALLFTRTHPTEQETPWQPDEQP